MFKALLAWAGIMAVRPPIPRSAHIENKHAHDAANREQALFSGAQAVVHQANRLSHVMDSDPTNISRVSKGVDQLRSTLAEVARRADR